MTLEKHFIDKQRDVISFGFICKQITVKNISSFPIYINYSGIAPNETQFDAVVAPKKLFTSSEISTQTITYFSTTISVASSFGEIIGDSVGGQPSQNYSLATEQMIGLSFPSYPHSFSVPNLGSLTYDLPVIDVSSVKNLRVKTDTLTHPTYLLLDAFNFEAFGLLNNLFSSPNDLILKPPRVPFLYQPRLRFTNNSGIRSGTIDIFITDEPEDLGYVQFRTAGIPTVTNTTETYAVKNQKFTFSLILQNTSGVNPLASTITISQRFPNLFSATIGLGSFAFNRPAGVATYVVINYQIILLNYVGFVDINMNNTGLSTINYFIIANY